MTSLVQGIVSRSGGPVTCDIQTFGDPSPGNGKHFGALVNRNGSDFHFACSEGQTIDFRYGGIPAKL